MAGRLDIALVELGLVQSRERAKALIMAGKVRVDGHTVTKAGHKVKDDAEFTLVEPDHPYASRGGLKLAKGLSHFAIAPTGFVCLDVGASTGGFTDVLLQQDAAKVYAVDVGYGQLAWKLRQDARVVVLERWNIRKLTAEQVPEPCDLGVTDVSFISLTKVLGPMANFLKPEATIMALIKPQFEVGKDLVGKGGVVRDEQTRLLAVEKIKQWTSSHDFIFEGYVTSPITGPAGNVEYLAKITCPAQKPVQIHKTNFMAEI